MLHVPADLDIASALEQKVRILEQFDEVPGTTVEISLGSDSCTQISLQLFLAAEREARRRGLSLELCPHAASILDHRMTSQSEEAPQ